MKYDYSCNENERVAWKSNGKKWYIVEYTRNNGEKAYYITDGWTCNYPILYSHNGKMAWDKTPPEYIVKPMYKILNLQAEIETVGGYGVYNMGLCGYKVWADGGDYALAQFVGTEKIQPIKQYRIQFTNAGRGFIRPYGRRIYFDEVMRV